MKLLKLFAFLTCVTLVACDSPTSPSQPSSMEIEALATEYYKHLADYDFTALRQTTTPEFEAIEHTGSQAMRMTRDEFEQRLQGAQAAGAVLKFSLSDFKTRVTQDAAYTSYLETSAVGKKYFAGMAFVRNGEKWQADRLFTLPIPGVPASQQSNP